MYLSKLKEFWHGRAKPSIEGWGWLFAGAIVAVPAYGILIYIRDWTDSSRGFLSGFSLAEYSGPS
jgi:hypothetical protein